MNPSPDRIRIMDSAGAFATFDAAQYADRTQQHIVVYLPTGRTVHVARDLILQDNDLYMLRADLNQLTPITDEGVLLEEERIIPVMREEVAIGRRVVESGTVTVRKDVLSERVTVDEPTHVERVAVERVERNTPIVGDAPAPYYDGDTLIIPVVKEVLFIERRLVLTEEIHVRRERVAIHNPQTVELRREEVTVERDAFTREAIAQDALEREALERGVRGGSEAGR